MSWSLTAKCRGGELAQQLRCLLAIGWCAALQQIQRISADLQNVATQIMNTDPSAFLIPDANNDVNTPVNPGG